MRELILCMLLSTPFICKAQTTDNDSIKNAELQEVVVTGERSLIKAKNGVLSVDVKTIISNKPATNIYEALSYAPGLSTDANGELTLAGASGVNILINGKKPQMPLSSVIALLKSYPVDKLNGLDILYSTPAKYHVDGASINIILKEASPFDGLKTQIGADYVQRHYPTGDAHIAADYATEKVSLDMLYKYTVGKSWAHHVIDSRHKVGADISHIYQDEQSSTTGQSHNAHVGMGWKLGTHNLTASYNAQISPVKAAVNHSTGSLGDYTTTIRFPDNKTLHNINLGYDAPFGLSLGASLTTYDEYRNTELEENSVPDKLLGKYSSTQRIRRYHFYANQKHTIGTWELNYGGEASMSRDFSSQQYYNTDSKDFATTLHESLINLYIGTEHSFNNGLSFSTSFKTDYYNRKGYLKWWASPQIGMSYMQTPKHIFQLALSSSMQQPTYWEIHGGRTPMNNYMAVLGNPNLTPSYTYQTQLVYLYKQKYMAVLYSKYADRFFMQLPYQSPTSLELLYKTQNFDYNNTTGLMIRIPFNIGRVLNSSVTLNGYYNNLKGVNFDDIKFNAKKLVCYTELQNTIKPIQQIPLYLTLNTVYISPSLQGYTSLSAIWKQDAGLKWTFMKGNADFVLKWDDIFNTWSPTMRIDKYGQDFTMHTYDLTNSFQASIVFRFNGFKSKQINVDNSHYGMGN